jgi:hypothetical protein
MKYDISGPEGNVFSILANAQSWAKSLGWSRSMASDVIDAAQKQGSYAKVLAYLEQHFPVEFIDEDGERVTAGVEINV